MPSRKLCRISRLGTAVCPTRGSLGPSTKHWGRPPWRCCGDGRPSFVQQCKLRRHGRGGEDPRWRGRGQTRYQSNFRKNPPKMACEQCPRDWHRPNRREPDGLGSRMILRALTLPCLSRECRLKTEKLHEQQHRSAGQREYRRGRETLQHHCAPQPKVEATVIEYSGSMGSSGGAIAHNANLAASARQAAPSRTVPSACSSDTGRTK